MKLLVFFCALVLLSCSHNTKKVDTADDDSAQYNWLEKVNGSKALDWVKAENESTLKSLQEEARYSQSYEEALKILNNKDRIPYGSIRGGYVYNFWQDQNNEKGLWRRATIASYSSHQPEWEVLLDIDKLAKDESEPWVYKGVECNPKNHDMCIVKLSRGGKDASVLREFNLNGKNFVKDGFNLPEAKSDITWVDADNVLVTTDFGMGTLTNAGYPRIIKLWTRGTPLSEAKVILESPKEHAFVWSYQTYGSSGDHLVVAKGVNFYENELFYVDKENAYKLMLIPIPRDAELVGIFNDRFILKLRSPWMMAGVEHSEGSLVDFSISEFVAQAKITSLHSLFVPSREESIKEVRVSENAVYVSVLRHVKAHLKQFQYRSGKWRSSTVKTPKSGTVNLISVNPDSDQVLFTYEGFLTPTQLYISKDTSLVPKLIKSLPHQFSANGLQVQQKFAKSFDGTQIPYFIISKRRLQRFGENKTLLYAYGGFEISLTPDYDPLVGKMWLEQGGVYVVANIRGGGEYGPRWHQAALKENRIKAFEDFRSVAKDLIRRGITTSQHLGIKGYSNGGLLVGAAFTRYPELYGAVVCGVPLLDMLRYNKLLAGASWEAEYGDPDNTELRPVLASYSPFHNLKKSRQYPQVLFLTSTKDDRVHPGHARKMAAKMKDMGHPIYYYENIEGGHSAAADLEQKAKRTALEYSFLHKQLAIVDH